MRILFRALFALLVGAAALVFGVAAPAGATLYEIELEATAAPQVIIDLIDTEVEANTGSGASTIDNGHPTTWTGEDVDAVLAPTEDVRYRLAAYDLSYPAADCAVYAISITFDVTAAGPDVGVGDNLFFGILDADDNPIDGNSYSSPAAVGDTIQMFSDGNPSAASLRAGYQLGYGATTAQRGTPNISSGYTISTPDIVLTEDLSGCDIDDDGVADDIDVSPLDPCRPDEETNACVLSLAAQPTTTTTTTTSVPSPMPQAYSTPSSKQPAELAATGASFTLFVAGAAMIALGLVLVRARPGRVFPRP